MNREKAPLCIVFAMGMEAAPFLARVEVRRRWKNGKAVYYDAFFEGASVLVVKTGIGPHRAAAALVDIPNRPSAVLSVGTAGALSSGLRVGEMVVASETIDSQVSALSCSPDANSAIQKACGAEALNVVSGRVVTVTKAVFTRKEREQLHLASGAVAVDMESHALAEAAARHGVPFGCLRVISDDLSSPCLPEWPRMKGLWRRPAEWPDQATALVRWRLFLKDFKRCVHLLPPVLVRLLRTW